jgi:hypothetical protein
MPGGEFSGFVVRRDGLILDTLTEFHYLDTTMVDGRAHSYTVQSFNPFCGGSALSAPATGHLHPLFELATDLPQRLYAEEWYPLDFSHCSGVLMDSVFVSFHGGPYQYLRRFSGASIRDSIRFADQGAARPASHFMFISYRGTRRDTLISQDFLAMRPHPNSAEETAGLVPTEFFLDQNYPNPFNPSTTIRFGVPREAEVTLEIFDVLGRKAATLVDEVLQPGIHSVSWNCSSCPSGMYIVRIKSAETVLMRKMLLMK